VRQGLKNGCSAMSLATWLLGIPEPLSAVTTPVIDVAAVPAGGAIVLDADLTDEAWGRAQRIDEFVQREPAEGGAPSQRTEARIVFDETALYVAVEAWDQEADKIVGILTRRDQRSPSDWIRVIVDSYYDRRSAFEFSVNPAGVKADRYWFNDNNSDDSWDAVWDVQVARDARGWRAEFRIPFSQLRFNRTSDGTIGFAVVREIGRLAETSTWPLLARSANGYVSSFGDVTGVEVAGTPKKLELAPYTVGQVVTTPSEDVTPATEATDPGASMGLDLKYALRPGLTLTATANPDFGQVEADPAVVNLDAFEVFFPERRPFFVEGSGNFQFSMDCNDGSCTGLFYSRRIGRAPQGEVETEDGEYAASPDTVTIIGAGKLTGRVGAFAVGALSAVTAEEKARVARDAGPSTQVTVEPLSAYTVARARREFANQSNIGFMLTSTNRQLVESVDFLPSDAYTGGVDYDLRLSPKYSVSGFWAGSHVQGSPEAMTELQENNVHAFQRPDADYLGVDPLATSLSGHAGSVAFSKIGGERTRFNTNVGFKSPGFDINDLGFQRRADERTMGNWFHMRHDTPGTYVRSFRWNLNQWAGWNFGGDRLWSGANVNMHWIFQNNYRAGYGINVDGAPLRDRVTRGGPAVRGNPGIGVWFYASADDRRALFPGYNGFHWTDAEGSVRHEFSPSITWRPTSAFSMSTGFRYWKNDDDAQWVENVEGEDGTVHYVFGRIRQRTASMTFRVNYTMTPDLSFQSYMEPFVSTGAYSQFKEVTDGRAPAYADRYQPFDYTDDADFNYQSFRTTNVLRWEYKAGSTLFVVWQQRREGDGEDGHFRFGRDFGGVYGLPAHNVFLVKLSYWLNM
jgi:Domain of unknown function (DUF5916)/Carbohydrate family 9 binding domain-like